MKISNKLIGMLALTSVSVFADPIKIQLNGGSETDQFAELGITSMPITSVYTAPTSVNSIDDLLTNTGPLPITPPSVIYNYSDPIDFNDVGSAQVGQLSPLVSGDASYGTDWTLDLSYSFSGTAIFVDSPTLSAAADGTMDANNDDIIDAQDRILPTFNEGLFKIFYNDLTGASTVTKQVLQLDLKNVAFGAASVVVSAAIDAAWMSSQTDPVVQNFFQDVQTGQSFFDLVTDPINPREIVLSSDFNITPDSEPLCISAAPCTDLSRQTNINFGGSFTKVPEPSHLIMFALGLLGLSRLKRNKTA